MIDGGRLAVFLSHGNRCAVTQFDCSDVAAVQIAEGCCNRAATTGFTATGIVVASASLTIQFWSLSVDTDEICSCCGLGCVALVVDYRTIDDNRSALFNLIAFLDAFAVLVFDTEYFEFFRRPFRPCSRALT